MNRALNIAAAALLIGGAVTLIFWGFLSQHLQFGAALEGAAASPRIDAALGWCLQVLWPWRPAVSLGSFAALWAGAILAMRRQGPGMASWWGLCVAACAVAICGLLGAWTWTAMSAARRVAALLF